MNKKVRIRVLFRGGFGWNNLGDDIYELIIREDLSEKYEIILLGRKEYLNFFKVYSYLKKSDIVVLGPGGVYDGRIKRMLSDLYIIIFTFLAKLMGKRVIALCVQAPSGVHRTFYSHFLTFLWFLLLDRIYVRFIKNYRELREEYPYFSSKLILCTDVAAMYINRLKENKEGAGSCYEEYISSVKESKWTREDIISLLRCIRRKNVKVDRLHTLLVALLGGAKEVKVYPYHWKVTYLIYDIIEREKEYKKKEVPWNDMLSI